MNCSTPGLLVDHQLPEFTQSHVHWVSDAIQPSHPLSSPSPPAPNPSQHQSFPMSQIFAWGGQSIGVSALASFLPNKSQGWSPSEWTGWISLQSKGLSRVFSDTTVQKHQFFGAQLSLDSKTQPFHMLTDQTPTVLLETTSYSDPSSINFSQPFSIVPLWSTETMPSVSWALTSNKTSLIKVFSLYSTFYIH